MRVDELLREKQDERAALLAKSAPLRAKRDKLRAKIQPLEDEMRLLNLQIKETHGEKLFELENEIGALQRALGAKQFSAGN